MHGSVVFSINRYNFFFFLKILFFPFSPQSPPVHSCVFFVVGSSSCGMWDAASAWSDEQCHVRAQDSNRRNTGPPAAERANLTTRPRGQPLTGFLKQLRGPARWRGGEVRTFRSAGPGFAGPDPGRRTRHRLARHAVAGVPPGK